MWYLTSEPMVSPCSGVPTTLNIFISQRWRSLARLAIIDSMSLKSHIIWITPTDVADLTWQLLLKKQGLCLVGGISTLNFTANLVDTTENLLEEINPIFNLNAAGSKHSHHIVTPWLIVLQGIQPWLGHSSVLLLLKPSIEMLDQGEGYSVYVGGYTRAVVRLYLCVDKILPEYLRIIP